MINENLTDEDVVEGLERCISTTTAGACVGCPFNKQKLCDKDQWALERHALGLINRQKSEIERLKSANDEKFRQWDMLAEKTKQHYADLYNEAKDKLKAEAYKEFAEELKNILRNIPKWNVKKLNFNNVGFSYDDVFFSIDNLLKEMLGEE